MIYRVKGSLLIGIFLTSIISWPRDTAVTYFPHTESGDQLFAFFKQVVTWHPLQHIGNVLDVSRRSYQARCITYLRTKYNYGKGKVWYALITFLYVDILGKPLDCLTFLRSLLSTDTTGTLYSMAKFAGLRDPVTLDFENSTIAYCVDAFSISIGALLGTSPVTAFIESATGIAGAFHRFLD